MRISVTTALILGFLSSPFLGCGDDDFGGASPKCLSNSVTFPTQLGSFSERTLTIENRGGGDLVIADFIFTNETNTAEFSRAGRIAADNRLCGCLQFDLTIRPIDLGDDQGHATVSTTVKWQVVVRLRTAGATTNWSLIQLASNS